jgi:polygalacturonase
MSTKRREGDESGAVSRRRFMRTSALLGGGLATTTGLARASRGGPAARGPYFDVRDFGAIGDGRADDTAAIQGALDACRHAGGGIVQIPAGGWLSGTLQLYSRLTLELGPGATLLASEDDDDFAPSEAPRFRTGSDVETIDFAHALLAGHDLERVAIVGAGTIDMNRDGRHGPKPIALKRCRFVTVQGVTILHSPNYCVSLGGCEDVLVDGVTIRDAYADGIDPDCCRRVRISNCDVEADDDALCLKTSFLLGARGATEDVVVTNCRLRSPSNCFKLGTESSGDFRQIVMSNCVLDGSPPEDRDASAAAEGGGIAILTVDGGTIDGVLVSNCVMRAVPAPLFVRLGNRGRDQRRRAPGRLRNVTITGIVAVGATGTGSIAGLPGHPVERVTVENVRISATGGCKDARDLDISECEGDYPEVSMYGDLPAFGLYVRHGRDVVLRNVELNVERDDARPALVADDVTGLQITGLGGGSGNAAGPVVWLNDIRGGLVQGNLAPADVGVFLRVSGENTKSVALAGNAYWTPGPVEVAPEITPKAVMQVAEAALLPRSG